jgi:hypothetical protein
VGKTKGNDSFGDLCIYRDSTDFTSLSTILFYLAVQSWDSIDFTLLSTVLFYLAVQSWDSSDFTSLNTILFYLAV